MSGEFRIQMDDEVLKSHAGSKHVGMPNERMDFVGLKVIMRVEKEGDFGIVTVLGFEDANGNVLIWFASGRKEYDNGAVVNLRATVKGYDESDGVRKTVITRAADVEGRKAWSPRAVVTRSR